MPLFPYFPNANLQPITPTTQSLQSLLSPTSSSAPFFSMLMAQTPNENISNSSHPISSGLLSPTASSAPSNLPLPIPMVPHPLPPKQVCHHLVFLNFLQYFHPHLQPNMSQFGFFTTGPLPTLITNTASLEQVPSPNFVFRLILGGKPKYCNGCKSPSEVKQACYVQKPFPCS